MKLALVLAIIGFGASITALLILTWLTVSEEQPHGSAHEAPRNGEARDGERDLLSQQTQASGDAEQAASGQRGVTQLIGEGWLQFSRWLWHSAFSSDGLMVIFSALLTVATFFLVMFNLALWNATERQAIASFRAAKAAEASNEGAHRASVVPIWDTLGIKFGTDGWTQNTMRVKNWGGGIAKEVWGWGKIVAAPRPHTDPPPRPPYSGGDEGSRGIMAPGSEFGVTFGVEPVSRDVLTALPKDDQTLFFFGFVHYADAFSNDRETAYCMWYEHDPEKTRLAAEKNPASVEAISQGEWHLCRTGNAVR